MWYKQQILKCASYLEMVVKLLKICGAVWSAEVLGRALQTQFFNTVQAFTSAVFNSAPGKVNWTEEDEVRAVRTEPVGNQRSGMAVCS